jgi:DNA-directed RNA polymerase specialized sigma24 family protein
MFSTCTYLWVMATRTEPKSKLTLSVRKKHIAMLRRASARRGRSITQLVEELAESLDTDQDKPEELSDFVKRNMGSASGRLKPSAWEGDDMLGDILRKHVPRK